MKTIAYKLCEEEQIKEKFSVFKTIKNHRGKIAISWIVLWLIWGWMPPPA